MDLYKKTHVTIQVSRHEGLGLGFYESLGMGVPVLTLDVPPHNEIITNGKNGWTIPANMVPMTDNTESIMLSAEFQVSDLAKKMIDISERPFEYKDMAKRCKVEYPKGHHAFVQEFLSALL